MTFSEDQFVADLIALDRDGGALPEQIYHAVGDAVRTGRIPPEGALPSSRALARELGVSRNTVNAAYELLRADGIIAVRQGAAPRIGAGPEIERARSAPRVHAPRLSARGAHLAERRRQAMSDVGLLEPGAPVEDLFPADEWARCLRRVARRRYGAEAMYANVAGLQSLRVALAEHLQRWRGVVATPEQLIVVPSAQAALTLAALCLADPGDTALVESPGYWGARIAFAQAQLQLRALEVDADGADPDCAADANARLIYVTPSHQFPTGARMPLTRRMALLERARRSGAVILEDDYDSAFLWRGRTIAAMQGISAGAEVIYLGTASKSLLPGLRLAYMVVPEPLVEAFSQVQRHMGLRVNIHAQAALAEFIETGALTTHLRRIARTYEARGRLLVETLRLVLGDRVEVEMPMGGVQTVVTFRGAVDDEAVSLRMQKAGFNTPALSGYCIGEPRVGLIVGFAEATPDIAARFARTLAAAV
ncbi:PLP-dependent aminotransferase family protein [Pelagibacterium xiamenense]|uniref:MocR-like pyridoxine biosynthesis transcription factor PdxR n=1 Tax=Pelagibacterium xiamenense TaxID=2901140 RepID=UPI001E4761D0|nr:PLP-dependent aminotransferase family protein [Pelagibacterium xiamenense]MCD7060408.1 PLP-dependent aminotransferase family protein [Pelagibacterium xiamenense]